MKYSGLAFQIVASLLVGLWVGDWIDKKLTMNPPIFTGILPLFLFFAVIFKLYRDLNKDDKS